jgi:hypothetical protein
MIRLVPLGLFDLPRAADVLLKGADRVLDLSGAGAVTLLERLS